MVSCLKTILYTNMKIQRKGLKLLRELLESSERLIDHKEKFFEDFFPRAQASEEKLENLLHDVAAKLSGRLKPVSSKGVCDR